MLTDTKFFTERPLTGLKALVMTIQVMKIMKQMSMTMMIQKKRMVREERGNE